MDRRRCRDVFRGVAGWEWYLFSVLWREDNSAGPLTFPLERARSRRIGSVILFGGGS